MSEKDIKLKVIEQAAAIAKAITRGNDVEIIRTSTGVSIKEISKKNWHKEYDCAEAEA